MTDNKIENEGSKMMSEMLKVNTTLTKLGLRSEEEEIQKIKKRDKKEE